MTTENRERFLRLNPTRTEKAVHAIQTLAQTGNRKTYEYSPEEAQACFGAIEDAARELYEALYPNYDLERTCITPETQPNTRSPMINTAHSQSKIEWRNRPD